MKTIKTVEGLQKHDFKQPFKLSASIPYNHLGETLGYVANILNFFTVWELVEAYYPDNCTGCEMEENDRLYRVIFTPSENSLECLKSMGLVTMPQAIEKYRVSTIKIVNQSLKNYYGL